MNIDDLGKKCRTVSFEVQLPVKRMLDLNSSARRMGKGNYIINLIINDESHPTKYLPVEDLKFLKKRLKAELSKVKKLLKESK